MDDSQDDKLLSRARADFDQARFKAFINSVRAVLARQPNSLLSFDDIKEKLHIGGRPRSERTPTRLDIQQKQIFRALNLDRFVASWYIQFSARTNPSKNRANWAF